MVTHKIPFVKKRNFSMDCDGKHLARVILEMDKYMPRDTEIPDSTKKPNFCCMFCEVSDLPIDEISKCCGLYYDLSPKTFEILAKEFENYVCKFEEENTEKEKEE